MSRVYKYDKTWYKREEIERIIAISRVLIEYYTVGVWLAIVSVLYWLYFVVGGGDYETCCVQVIHSIRFDSLSTIKLLKKCRADKKENNLFSVLITVIDFVTHHFRTINSAFAPAINGGNFLDRTHMKKNDPFDSNRIHDGFHCLLYLSSSSPALIWNGHPTDSNHRTKKMFPLIQIPSWWCLLFILYTANVSLQDLEWTSSWSQTSI